MDILKSSLKELSTALREKKISAEELTKFYLDRIRQFDKKINSFISLDETALLQAKESDKKIGLNQNLGKLEGLPFGIKDMFCTRGLKTTAASKILENFIPPYDATVVEKLKKQGIVVLGKLNQDEFAMGSSNETSFFGNVKNPWALDYVPGGSSGGSAAAQAAGFTAATLGTDTGGSIRQPASFCNLVGVKPTYGRISRYGIIAYASSLDQAGPMVNCVEDAALVLEVISGQDEKDGTTSSQKIENYSENIKFFAEKNKPLSGMKIGLLKEFMTDILDPEVSRVTNEAIESAKKLGAEILEVSVPLTEYAVSIYYLVASSEASSNLARYDGVKYGYRHEFKDLSAIDLDSFYSKTRGEGFGPEVQRRIMLGTYCLSSGYFDAYYKKSCQVRRLLKNEFDQVFKKCDVILSPVTTAPAFKIGSKISDPLAMYMNDLFTVSTNLAGLPGLSLPYGFSKDKSLPIGIQLMSQQFEEQKLLNVAYALEATTDAKNKKAVL